MFNFHYASKNYVIHSNEVMLKSLNFIWNNKYWHNWMNSSELFPIHANVCVCVFLFTQTSKYIIHSFATISAELHIEIISQKLFQSNKIACNNFTASIQFSSEFHRKLCVMVLMVRRQRSVIALHCMFICIWICITLHYNKFTARIATKSCWNENKLCTDEARTRVNTYHGYWLDICILWHVL